MNRTGISHLNLSVTDVARSAAWYTALLGQAQTMSLDTPAWQRTRLVWPDGFALVLTAHAGTAPDDRFDFARVGLDHFGIGCPTEQDIRAWADHMTAAGIAHSEVADTPRAWILTARDPDGIPVEFYCPKA